MVSSRRTTSQHHVWDGNRSVLLSEKKLQAGDSFQALLPHWISLAAQPVPYWLFPTPRGLKLSRAHRTKARGSLVYPRFTRLSFHLIAWFLLLSFVRPHTDVSFYKCPIQWALAAAGERWVLPEWTVHVKNNQRLEILARSLRGSSRTTTRTWTDSELQQIITGQVGFITRDTGNLVYSGTIRKNKLLHFSICTTLRTVE